jgi:hypothetical protein
MSGSFDQLWREFCDPSALNTDLDRLRIAHALEELLHPTDASATNPFAYLDVVRPKTG